MKSKFKKLTEDYSGIDSYCNPTTGTVLEYLKKLTLLIDKELINKPVETESENLSKLFTKKEADYIWSKIYDGGPNLPIWDSIMKKVNTLTNEQPKCKCCKTNLIQSTDLEVCPNCLDYMLTNDLR